MPETSKDPWEELKPSAKTSDAERPPRGASRPWSRWWILELVVAVLVAGALIAALVITKQQLNEKEKLEQARTSALASAQAYAVDIATYDYHHLDQDFARVTDHATGNFKDQFTKASGDLKPLIVQYQGTAKASVHGAGVSDASVDKVTVVLFVDQTVTNTNSPTPRVDRNRVTMTLERKNGQWLVSQVDLS